MRMFIPILIGALVLLAVLLPITRGLVNAIRKDDQSTGGKDAQDVQEMHRRINKVEQRIEALETIVFQSNKIPSSGDTKIK